MLQTGDGLLKQSDRTTKDGFKEIFTTNLFGHFILVIMTTLLINMHINKSIRDET